MLTFEPTCVPQAENECARPEGLAGRINARVTRAPGGDRPALPDGDRALQAGGATLTRCFVSIRLCSGNKPEPAAFQRFFSPGPGRGAPRAPLKGGSATPRVAPVGAPMTGGLIDANLQRSVDGSFPGRLTVADPPRFSSPVGAAVRARMAVSSQLQSGEKFRVADRPPGAGGMEIPALRVQKKFVRGPPGPPRGGRGGGRDRPIRPPPRGSSTEGRRPSWAPPRRGRG